ncbi:folylpolyglutamate synthase/dihydrofolate synthase family protein [Bacteroides sp. 519]|uniref:bifunctional folylpolyglutamate synthase/dihydrofolate synthase n=1 Tax=Bacteroides sp. 519 TaxID=2302937 RepID=UPI0013D77F0A|nr:folylpolyglutamate synthase/dihydrofolate synthase family protein [Bacteroides sp. 519]NDV59643.1 bifunctional folylpolyglutamate synthase/dihydrofolate synthase [Bacteroides sp. 519]
MNYTETLEYLYTRMPMFQQVGSKAYKEGLENTHALDTYFGHPHTKYKTIHIAGTNGKGTTSHTLAAILQQAGYKVGLYTSPHLVDFRERIRINGEMISEKYVIEFVHNHRAFFEPLYPSFFEITTAMAFLYFAEKQVDVAVIEVGLGGRLDCTNIINPDLSVITNISFDHTSLLGGTLEKIAAEKAGIIKPHTPVVIGETVAETRAVFQEKATEVNAPIVFAEDEKLLTNAKIEPDGTWFYETAYGHFHGELRGLYQVKNTNTIISAVHQLINIGYDITVVDVMHGFEYVTELTGLLGRWQIMQLHPLVICDTAHNVAGMKYIAEQLKMLKYRELHIVIGMVNDKDVSGVISLLPQNAHYYFTRASVERALPENELKEIAGSYGLHGDAYPDVVSALKEAQKKSLPEDVIFVGGSNFIVADMLSHSNTFNFH